MAGGQLPRRAIGEVTHHSEVVRYEHLGQPVLQGAGEGEPLPLPLSTGEFVRVSLDG